MFKVTAMDKYATVEKSRKLKIRPRVTLSVFEFSAKRSGYTDRIRLKWTTTPTNAGLPNIDHANKYISMRNIMDSKISSFEERTPCDPTKLSCADHTYKMSASDATWLCDGQNQMQ